MNRSELKLKGDQGEVWRLAAEQTKTAQINEALCKGALSTIICCLIQSIFELGIEPTFWAQEP